MTRTLGLDRLAALCVACGLAPLAPACGGDSAGGGDVEGATEVVDARVTEDAADASEVADATTTTDVPTTDVPTATDSDDVSSNDDATNDDSADAPDAAARGPQLVSSEPADGAVDAPLNPFVTLRFDRPVEVGELASRITATHAGALESYPMEVHTCVALGGPDDPGCLMALLDPALRDASGRLFEGTHYRIVIDKGLPDASGEVTETATEIAFTTFATELVFDDASAVPDELGGLAYDPGSRSLFYCGVSDGQLVVRRVRFDGLVPQPATTFARPVTTGLGGPIAYGLEVSDGVLYVAGSYASRVWVYTDLEAEAAEPARIITGTSLPAPDDSLGQVSSVAALEGGDRLLFGFGRYYGQSGPSAVASLRDDVWSLFGAGAYAPDQGFVVAARERVLPGVAFVSNVEGTVALSTLDGSRLNADARADSTTSVRIDAAGRLYTASSWGIIAWDAAGSTGFRLLARRDLEQSTLAVRDRGNQTVVYYAGFRGPAVVRSLTLTWCDGGGTCEPSCEDGATDAGETDRDCGGTCDPCPLGRRCETDTDCGDRSCVEGRCIVAAGCADGTREGFVDAQAAPFIAGCAGAWTVPGVLPAEPPSCGRRAGDDGAVADGVDCGVSDLCAEGWDVCGSASEVADRSPTGGCEGAVPAVTDDPYLFFATRQSGPGDSSCSSDEGAANDLFGCGNDGQAADPTTCAPLVAMSGDLCGWLHGDWSCGEDSQQEALAVTKSSSSGGGVLCCWSPPSGGSP